MKGGGGMFPVALLDSRIVHRILGVGVSIRRRGRPCGLWTMDGGDAGDGTGISRRLQRAKGERRIMGITRFYFFDLPVLEI